MSKNEFLCRKRMSENQSDLKDLAEKNQRQERGQRQ